MKRILDPSFKYKPSFDTDVRKTFERAVRQVKQAQEEARKRSDECAAWFDASSFTALPRNVKRLIGHG